MGVVFRSKGVNFGTTPSTSASIPKYVRTGGLNSKLDSTWDKIFYYKVKLYQNFGKIFCLGKNS